MTLAVLGTGIMGSGIAQAAAMSGYEVVAYDVSEEALDRAKATVEHSLSRFVKAGKLGIGGSATALEHITFTTDLQKSVRDATIVIEAVPEILELKREVLRAAISGAPDNALLGTNTSQLSITSIGANLGAAASRLVGMHFFNPPVMMQLVELICGLSTTDESLERAREFCESLGKEVVVCRKDSPGFLTSRAYAALRLECVRMVEEGLATPADVDTAFRLGFNFPQGPFELGDANGVDTFVYVLEALATAYGERFRPTPMLRNMIAANRLGRKSGRGFFEYTADGTRLDDEQDMQRREKRSYRAG